MIPEIIDDRYICFVIANIRDKIKPDKIVKLRTSHGVKTMILLMLQPGMKSLVSLLIMLSMQ